MTQTLPQTDNAENPTAPGWIAPPERGVHTHIDTIADELRRIANILDRTYALPGIGDSRYSGRISPTHLSIDLQVVSRGTAPDNYETVELLNDALHGTLPEYSRNLSFYKTVHADLMRGPGAQIHVYGDMAPPPWVIAEAIDAATIENKERNNAEGVRFNTWYQQHSDCCGTYQIALDHEHGNAVDGETTDQDMVLITALNQLDPAEPVTVIDVPVPCERCIIGRGRHTFGSNCNAQLTPVTLQPAFIAPAAADIAIVGPEIGYDGGLLHIIDPADVAPGEPDDRGWDAPIVPVYVDQLGGAA